MNQVKQFTKELFSTVVGMIILIAFVMAISLTFLVPEG